MSNPENSGPGANPSPAASPRLSQRAIKLNPVSAPGFKPVPPPSNPTHREEPPLSGQPSSSCLTRRETKQKLQLVNQALSGTAGLTSSSQAKSPRDKPNKLDFLKESDKTTNSASSSSVPSLPSPTSPLSPHVDSGIFSPRPRKTGASPRNQSNQSGVSCDKQYPIRDRTNVFEFGQEDHSSGQRARSTSRGDRIQVPSFRESRSPSPMSRRKQMVGNILNSTQGHSSTALDSNLIPSSEKKRASASKSPPIPQVNVNENPRGKPQIPPESPQKNFSSLGFRAAVASKTNDDNSRLQRGRSKGAITPATSLTTAGNSNKKSSNKIDINYCPASPLSPKKRQPNTGETPDSVDAFQDNYRFFLRDNSGASNNGDSKSNTIDERVKRMFSPAPVRDIFSPIPSVPKDAISSEDFLDSCSNIHLPSVSVKERKKTPNTGITFPAIRVENVDDSVDRTSDLNQNSSLNDNIGQGVGGICGGRRSRSVTSSSGSSSSTSPSPTTPPSTEFSRFKPTRAKSTNTLLSAEASNVIDSWLNPTLSTTPPPGSSPSSRHHPDDARLSWRKSSSSSTSCLLSVPPPLIKRQTSEGRLIVGVPDALTVPGEGGAGKKGMKSRGWSRSESNLFVRTGRPVGGAGEGGLKTELEDYEDGSNRPKGSTLATHSVAKAPQKYFSQNEDVTRGTFSAHESALQLKSQEKVHREPLAPPSIHTPDVTDSDLPELSPRPPNKPRPSYR